MLPPVLFFFIALMLIFAVMKLLSLQYSIRFYAFARAAIGALVLGKVVLLMEMAERKRNASR
jgi:fumarate reductase subunit D